MICHMLGGRSGGSGRYTASASFRKETTWDCGGLTLAFRHDRLSFPAREQGIFDAWIAFFANKKSHCPCPTPLNGVLKNTFISCGISDVIL